MKKIYNYKKSIIFFVLILWPFIFLFPLTFKIIVMGNDFDLVYFSYKKYIVELFFEGVIPLWSPSEAAGYPLIFNPFAQFFYIPGWINFLVYFVKNQITLNDYLNYTIFSLSIYSVGLYLWLKELKVSFWPAFTAVLIACCSLKLTEILRFPNAAHASAWFPWTLYGITLASNFKKKINSFLIIFFSFLFILTAGYPYFIVYSIFLFLPYTVFISLNTTRKKLLLSSDLEGEHKPTFFKFNLLCGSAFILSSLVALPWLLKVKFLMGLTTDRVINNWQFATAHEFYWIDTLGSWLFPPASSTEGWYYFGIISTILIFFLIINLFLKKVKDDKQKFIVISSVIWILFITYFSWGKHSLLFSWVWHNVPLIGQLRTWPRINIILVPIIALMISISISRFISIFENLNLKEDLQIQTFRKKYIKIFFVIGIVIISIQSFFTIFDISNEAYWQTWQGKRFSYAIEVLPVFIGNILKLYDGEIYIIFTIIALLTLIGILSLKKEKLFEKNYRAIISITILFITSSELFVISNLQWALPKWKTDLSTQSQKPLKKLQEAFMSPRIVTTVKGNNYFRNEMKFNLNYPDNYGYASHAENFSKYFKRYGGKKHERINKDAAILVDTFYGLDEKSKKIFFSEKIDYASIEDFMIESEDFENESNFKFLIDIKKYNGNQLFLEVESENSGWVSFIDNWDQDWKAFVNEEPVKIFKLFNSYKTIKIGNGKSKIVFKYIPWSGNNGLSIFNKLYKSS